MAAIGLKFHSASSLVTLSTLALARAEGPTPSFPTSDNGWYDDTVTATIIAGDGSTTGTLFYSDQAMTTTFAAGFYIAKNASNTFPDFILDINGGGEVATIHDWDNIAPQISLTGASTVDIYVGTAYSDLGATATDNVDDNATLTAAIVIDASAVNVNAVGNYTVTYDVSDSSGNAASQVIRTVNVIAATTTTTTTTLAPAAISFTSSGSMSFDANGQTPQLKIFTITSNSTNFAAANIISNDAWLVPAISSADATGGTLSITCTSNLGTISRSTTFKIEHPEDNAVFSQDITVTQAGGDAIPITPDFTGGTDQNTNKVLNFDTPSGWAGTGGSSVSDAEDSFANDTLTIEITGISSLNGVLIDNNITSGPDLAVGDTLTNTGTITGEPSVRYEPTTGYIGNASFTYKAVDDVGNESTGTVTITVSAPGNTAPMATNATNTIAGAVTGATSVFGLSNRVSDDSTSDENLVYYWCSDLQKSNPVQFTRPSAGAVKNGTYGTIVNTVTGSGVPLLQYTYTGPTLTPGQTSSDSFYFFVKDDNTTPLESDVAQLTINMSGAANTAPVIYTSATSGIQQSTLNYTGAQGITFPNGILSSADIVAVDNDAGDSVTWTIQNSISATNGSLTIDSSTGQWNYSSAPSDIVATDTTRSFDFTVIATDTNGGSDSYDVNIDLDGASYITVLLSGSELSSGSACDSNRSNTVYLDSTQATDINILDIGDSIYTINTLLPANKIKPVNTSWYSIQQTIGTDVVIKALEIDNTGAITNILPCEITTGNAWQHVVYYSTDASDLCNLEYQEAVVWQNVLDPNINSGITLDDIVNAGGQLFGEFEEYRANLPENINANGQFADIENCSAVGFYSDITSSANDIYYEFEADAAGKGSWASVGAVAQITCPVQISYTTYSAKVFYSTENRTKIDVACLSGSLVQSTIYFRADVSQLNSSDTNVQKLLYLVQNQILAFKTQDAANSLDYSQLWDNTVFIAGNEASPIAQTELFALWTNDNSSGYSGNFAWYGMENNIMQSGNAGSSLGSCSNEWIKPINNITYCHGSSGCNPTTGTSSRENVYYAFYGCTLKTESTSTTEKLLTPYWTLYVIDGLHTITAGSTSYIKEMVDELNPSDVIGGSTLLECMSIQHKIFAVNMDDAVSIMAALPEYGEGVSDIRIQPINSIDLGFTSQASILYYGNALCTSCLLGEDVPDDTLNFTLSIVEDGDVINRSIPNFDLESNYQLDNVSKPLLRTNPKLSTNAKLVVNSTGEMYIESIDATKDLSSVEYKKWAINKNGQWAYDLAKFYSSNKTTSDQIFFTKTKHDDSTVQASFANQIEEDYHYGTTYNYSKLHGEDFRMLAPIWLDKNLPSKFVIFRVEDPAALDFDANSNLSNMSTILSNSKIIKTFDLNRESDLGTYIRNHVKSEAFPKTPISFNFDENERTNFNGIDLKNGGFTNKGEYLFDDLVSKDQTLIAENTLITDGFERNNLACANLINLEFLFNDNSSEAYAVNRYFGLYVNDIDSGYGTLNTGDNGLLKFKTLNSYINNDDSSAIPPYKLISELPTLGYAHISDKFYKISPDALYDTSKLEVMVEDPANEIAAMITLAPNGKSVDIKTDEQPGGDFIKLDVLTNPAVNDGFAIFPCAEQSYRIKFSRYNPGDSFMFGVRLPGATNSGTGDWIGYTTITFTLGADLTGVTTILNTWAQGTYGNISFVEDGNSIILVEDKATLELLSPKILPNISNISLVRIEELQVPYSINNNMFFGVDIPAGTWSDTTFSINGTKAEVAAAVVGSINSKKDNGFTAKSYDGADHFYIKNNIVGYRLLQAGLAIPNHNANDWVAVNSEQEINYERNELRLFLKPYLVNSILTTSRIFYFNGGNQSGKSVLATIDSVNDINIGDYIDTRATNVYNKIIDIVDDIERLPLQYKKLVLDKTNTLESGEVTVYADRLVKLGLFSAFDIHDMNFDFYDTSNSELKELKYETPQNIAYEPETDNTNDIYPFGNKDNSDYVIPTDSYFAGLSDVLTEEQSDTQNQVQIKSEYDRLQENYLKEYATRSRVVPNVNKWVLKNTCTVRENPYYLNANEAFGRTNFAADLGVGDRDRDAMTHVWFYINNVPNYLSTNTGTTNPTYKLNESFSYINFMEGFEMTPAIFKDVNYDYFDRFFVTEGFETEGVGGYKTFVKTNLQKKYTLVDGGNDTGFSSTIFKGLKVIFKNRKEFIADSPVDFIKSPEFNGYKFSILLNVKTAQDSNGIEYEIIQNKKFKSVVFFISLSIDDLWANNTLNRKLLYELNHSLVWNNEAQTFKYSDIKMDGAFDFNSANLDNPTGDDYGVLYGINHVDGSIPQFLEQINKNDDDAYGNIDVDIYTAFGIQKIRLGIANIESQDKITLALVDDGTGTLVPSIQDLATSQYITLDTLPEYLQWNAKYTYAEGGINAYKSILDALTAQNVAEMLLRNPSNIKYVTVNTNGTLVNNNFIILFEDGVEIIKEAYLTTVEDDDKPKSFKLSKGNIGYDLAMGLTYYPFLVRHNGDYTVDTVPVVTFTDVYAHMKTNTLHNSINTSELALEEQMYKHSLTDVDAINLAKDYYKRYNRCGVAFNLGFIYDGGAHDLEWGYIKNHFYRKVNEFNSSGVIKLSTSSDKLPLYPLIGEVAIDKKNVHVFKSSWDKNYYTRGLSGGGSELVPGTFETKEERSYLASTIMKTEDSYTMLDFEIQTVNSEEEQDDILSNSTNTTDIVMYEDANRVVLDFYVDFSVNKKLSDSGVLSAISSYVTVENSAGDKTTLTDDAQLYIQNNLVGAFDLNQVKLYTLRQKGIPSSVESTATIGGLDNNGFIVDQNFNFTPHAQKPLNFRLIYNKRLGYSYRIRPMVKITS